MAGRRAKWGEIWETGIVCVCIWGTRNLFEGILGLFGALISTCVQYIAGKTVLEFENKKSMDYEIYSATVRPQKYRYVQLLELQIMAKFLAQICTIRKSAYISETTAHGAKNKLYSTLWGKESICATSGTFVNAQVSHPTVAILKISLYLGIHCS